MDAQLCEKKKVSQCNGTRILPGKWQSTVRGLLTVHSNNIVEEPEFKNVKNKHLGMPPFEQKFSLVLSFRT